MKFERYERVEEKWRNKWFKVLEGDNYFKVRWFVFFLEYLLILDVWGGLVWLDRVFL